MKKPLLLAWALCLSLSLQAHHHATTQDGCCAVWRASEHILNGTGQQQDTIANKGIRFEDLTLQEALDKAKAEGKKVFVDCYTQTCIPCKYMMKNIFPLEECGDYFNPRYVCITRDMNAGEGPEMGKKYEVGLYPTFLIINPDGTLYCKEMGAVMLNSKVTFVEKMKCAVECAELAKRYEAGERDVTMVDRYLELLKGSGSMKTAEVVNDYLMPMSIDELCQEANWAKLSADVNSPDAPIFRRLLDNREKFESILGRQAVEGKLMTTYQNEFNMYKMMGMDFDKRIADLETLDKAGYKQARTLAYCMTVRQIINEKQQNRCNDIVSLLQRLKPLLTDEACVAVVKELSSFERVASTAQRQKACAALRSLQKQLSAPSAIIEKAIARISPNK